MSTENLLQIGGLVAGFLIILSAFIITLRQNAMTIPHVMVFAFGAVLAGVSGIRFSTGPGGDVNLEVGAIAAKANSTAAAAADNSRANSLQGEALKEVNDRMRSIEATLTDLIAANRQQTAARAEADPPVAPDSPATASAGDELSRIERRWRGRTGILDRSSRRIDALATRSQSLSTNARRTLDAVPAVPSP